MARDLVVVEAFSVLQKCGFRFILIMIETNYIYEKSSLKILERFALIVQSLLRWFGKLKLNRMLKLIGTSYRRQKMFLEEKNITR